MAGLYSQSKYSITETPRPTSFICNMMAYALPSGTRLELIKAPEDVVRYKDNNNLIIKDCRGTYHIYQFYEFLVRKG